MRKKKMLPKDLFFMEKISSIVLAVVLIANLFFGYIPALAANGDVQETGPLRSTATLCIMGSGLFIQDRKTILRTRYRAIISPI